MDYKKLMVKMLLKKEAAEVKKIDLTNLGTKLQRGARMLAGSPSAGDVARIGMRGLRSGARAIGEGVGLVKKKPTSPHATIARKLLWKGVGQAGRIAKQDIKKGIGKGVGQEIVKSHLSLPERKMKEQQELEEM